MFLLFFFLPHSSFIQDEGDAGAVGGERGGGGGDSPVIVVVELDEKNKDDDNTDVMNKNGKEEEEEGQQQQQHSPASAIPALVVSPCASERRSSFTGIEGRSRSRSVGERQWTRVRAVMTWYTRLRRIKK